RPILPSDPPEFDDRPTRPRDEVLAYAYRRGQHLRLVRRLALAAPAVVGIAVLIGIAAAAVTTRSRPVRVISNPPVTAIAPTTPTTSAVPGTVLPVRPSITIPKVRTTVPPTTLSPPTVSGRVAGPDGKPVA